MKEHIHVTEFLPGYALDCLEAEEAVMVAEHLATCQQCREELETFHTIIDQLALAMPEVQPPADLKHRILREIQPEIHHVSKKSCLSQWRQRLFLFFRPAVPVCNIASAVLIVLLGISTIFFWQQSKSLQQLFQTDDFQLVVLKCTHVVPNATGQIVVSNDGEMGTLAVAHLPALEPGYHYQVWLLQNGQRRTGGVFSVNQQGYGMLKIASPHSLLECEILITIEPEHGSIGPSGKPVLQTMI